MTDEVSDCVRVVDEVRVLVTLSLTEIEAVNDADGDVVDDLLAETEMDSVVDFELENVDDNVNVSVTDTVPETDLVTEAVFVAEPILDDPAGHE